jgi:hypothetical protein
LAKTTPAEPGAALRAVNSFHKMFFPARRIVQRVYWSAAERRISNSC